MHKAQLILKDLLIFKYTNKWVEKIRNHKKSMRRLLAKIPIKNKNQQRSLTNLKTTIKEDFFVEVKEL